MTETNPPTQPEKLRRRILFLLKEKDKQDEYCHLFQIASDLEETPEDIKDQLDILKDLGLIEVTFFTDGDALPFITGKGLKLTQWEQEAPEVKVSPPASENLSSVEELFKDHPAFGTLIVPGDEPDTYRLNLK